MCTFFSCRCGVRARGCENNGQANSSGWGWYQRAERAKFRRVVVDAKGQRGIGLLLMEKTGEGEDEQEKNGMGITML